MNKVYYRGEAYDYDVIDMMGQQLFVLYKNGNLTYYVKEEELDIRSRVSMILDAYYRHQKPNTKSEEFKTMSV